MRTRLPDRRPAMSFDLTVAGLQFTATVGSVNGRVMEVFLQNHKPGSAADFFARDAAIAASLALQFGCPLEVLRRAVLRDPRGAPSTPLGAAIDVIAGMGG
jgi:hypothetical protein